MKGLELEGPDPGAGSVNHFEPSHRDTTVLQIEIARSRVRVVRETWDGGGRKHHRYWVDCEVGLFDPDQAAVFAQAFQACAVRAQTLRDREESLELLQAAGVEHEDA